MDPSPQSDSGRIAGLDGLRAVSILLVILGHGWFSLPLPGTGWSAELVTFLGNSSLGVTTFFVISGYLITHLLRREWEQTGSISIRNFYGRRILRIFPALYAYLSALALLRLARWIGTRFSDLIFAGLFLTNYEFIFYRHVISVPTNEQYWFVGHFWTLSLEEQFYLLWPGTILLATLSKSQRVALAIVLLCPMIRVLSYVAWPESRPHLTAMLHTGVDPIMIGCLAALWQGQSWFEELRRKSSSRVLACAVAGFVFFISPILAAHFHGAYLITAGLTLNAVSIAYLMLWIVRHPESLAGRILSTPLLRHIGILSYSLYLWQQLFLTKLNHTWTALFPLNFAMCFVAAEFSYWIVERPFLRLRSRFR